MGLYTVGHSTNSQEQFLWLLARHGINTLLDVRSTPFSRYASQFNEGVLGSFLESNGIRYFAAGKPFGARREDARLYPNGFLDFELVRQTDIFRRGVEHVLARLRNGENVALMCTEKHPLDCHRAIMVARGFELVGIEVWHILQDASLLSQHDLNEQLLDRYFPDRAQMSLFSTTGDNDLIANAYRLQNERIGYRLDPAYISKENA